MIPVLLQIFGITQEMFDDVADFLSSTIGILIVVGALIFAVYSIIRIVSVEASFVKSRDRRGFWRFHSLDLESVAGNINLNHDLERSKIYILKQIPEVKAGIEEFEKIANTMHWYDIRIKDEFKADLTGGKNGVIVSPYDILLPEYWREDEKGELAIWGQYFKIFPQTVTSFHSERYDLKDYDGKDITVWFIAPISKKATKLIKQPSGKVVYQINITKLPNVEALANMTAILPGFSDIYKQIKIKDNQLDQYEKNYSKLHEQNTALNLQKEGYKALTTTHPLYGIDPKQRMFEKKSVLGVAFGALLAGYLLPKLTELDFLSGLPDFLFLGVGAIIILALIMSKESKKPQTPEEAISKAESE